MEKTRIVLVGPLPPPYSGQSISFRMLLQGVEERHVSYDYINLTTKSIQRAGRQPTFRRAIEFIAIFFTYMRKTLGGKKVIYLTIAQTRRGFFRDFVLIWFARLNHHQIIAHLKGGNYGKFYARQSRWLRWIIRHTLSKAARLVVLGERLRDMYDFEPQLRDRIQVVFNGLPFTVSRQIEPKTLPKDCTEPVNILFLSNLIESKGYFGVLEAIRILVQEYRLNVRGHFCGRFRAHASDDIHVKSPVHAKFLFEDFIRRHDLCERVVYHGVVAGKIKEHALLRSHFFVLPTNYDNEGQPVSIIEAMAYGNVVISTDYRAIPDMVIDNESGFLIPYDAPRAIAEKIVALIDDPQRYTAMSQAAIERYRKFFTREAHLRNLLHILAAGTDSSDYERTSASEKEPVSQKSGPATRITQHRFVTHDF